MANQMWMGIPYGHAQWVPCPLIDSTITRNRYVERIQFQGGGGDIARSNQYQMEYNINVNGLAHEVEGVDAYNRFASGLHGDGYVYVAYPPHFGTNIFSAQWATPTLSGWTNSIYSNGTVVDNPGDLAGTNFIPNPNFETTGAMYWTSSAGSGLSHYASTSNPAPGNTKSLYVAYTSDSTAGLKYTFNLSDGNLGPDGVYSLAVWGLVSNDSVAPYTNTFVSIQDSSGTELYGGWIGRILQAGQVQKLAGWDLIQSDYPTATKVVFDIHREEIAGNAMTLYVHGATMIDAYIGYNYAYFDGNTTAYDTLSFSWTGTANASKSVVTSTYFPPSANLPSKSMSFNIVGGVDSIPDQKFTIAVPPNYALVYGICGKATGSGVVKARQIELDGTFAESNVGLIPLGYEGSRFQLTSYGGTNGCFVQFYLSKTTSADSTVILNSLDARLIPMSEYSGSHPYFSQMSHVMGEGSTGLMFADDAIVETYSYLYPPRKAISTKLVEVEAWR